MCLPELSSVRYAHEENPAAPQTCAQRTLPLSLSKHAAGVRGSILTADTEVRYGAF